MTKSISEEKKTYYDNLGTKTCYNCPNSTYSNCLNSIFFEIIRYKTTLFKKMNK